MKSYLDHLSPLLQEYNVSPWKVSVMVVLLGALWWFNYAFRTDTDDNNVFLKQLKEEKTHKKQQPEV
jgi:cytochrome c-type biogenesis protein CcmH/NrfF